MCKYSLLYTIVILFVLLNSSTIYCSPSEPWAESGNIIALTNQNFKLKTKQYDVLLVMFYVKWCSHCRRLHPNYEEASAKLLENIDSPIYIAKFDCTNDDETQCSRTYNIRGYPTLRIYRYGQFNGEELNYLNRTTDELVKTMKTLTTSNGKQGQISYNSVQTDGVKDEMNKAALNVHYTWLIVILFMVLYKLI